MRKGTLLLAGMVTFHSTFDVGPGAGRRQWRLFTGWQGGKGLTRTETDAALVAASVSVSGWGGGAADGIDDSLRPDFPGLDPAAAMGDDLLHPIFLGRGHDKAECLSGGGLAQT